MGLPREVPCPVPRIFYQKKVFLISDFIQNV